LQKFEVSKVIIAQKNLDPVKKTKLLINVLTTMLRVQTIPDASAWINGELSPTRLKV
jgi:hypothetical protein